MTLLPSDHERPGFVAIRNILGASVILLLAAFQSLGYFQPLEIRLENFLKDTLPPRILPEAPHTVLLTLEESAGKFHSMDVAMALRGLSRLGPRCIVVNGEVEPEQGPVPFLPTIITKLKSIPGLTLIRPVFPSPSAAFRSQPLIRYSLTPDQCAWPQVEGKPVQGTGDAFLPKNGVSADSLPLFASTPDGATVASPWWWALPRETQASPPLLLWGTILLLANNTPFHLTPAGTVSPFSGEVLEMALDDFLLQIEQKEQGTISPTFDTLWSRATVVLGSHDDLSKAALFAALLREATVRRLPLVLQLLIASGWTILLLTVPKIRWGPAWLIPISMISVAIVITCFFLLKGILFPFLPALFTAALLLFSDKR